MAGRALDERIALWLCGIVAMKLSEEGKMDRPGCRDRARMVPCPRCHSLAGFACLRADGTDRASVHRERHVKAKAAVEAAKPADDSTSRRFYSSSAWRAVRYEALRRYGPACQCCGSVGTQRNPVQVDHVKPKSKFPELALQVSNLQILCVACNFGKGANDQTDWRKTS